MEKSQTIQQSPQPNTSSSSWIQLGLFTAFLFLLVAIPYTIYLKASTPSPTVHIANLPPQITTAKPFPIVTPPQASTTTTCTVVPDAYTATIASPAAYFFKDRQKQICFPPSLPPFPFIWQPYRNYEYGYTIDTPTNWNDTSTTLQHITLHIFSADDTSGTSAISTTSAAPTVSFAWYPGIDPYATESSYLQQPVKKDGVNGAVYTQGNGFIAAVFPLSSGYLLLEATRMDGPLYAFQHMLDSLQFNK